MPDVGFGITADPSKVQRAFDAAQKKLDELKAKMDGVATVSKRQSHEQVTAMDAVGASVGRVVGHYASLGAILGTVAKGLANVKQAADEAAAAQRGSRMELGELAQLATSKEDYQALVQQAKRLYAVGGAASMGEAAKTVFSVASAGDLAALPLYGELRATGLVQDPAKLAKAVATLKTSLGERETGPTRGVVSKLFAASAFAPTRAEELGEAAARAGTAAAALGISDEEVLAATAMAAKATGSGERGGERIAGLMRSLGKLAAPPAPGEEPAIWPPLELKGKDLGGMIGEIEKRKLDTGQLTKLFGREEAVDAYRILLQNQQQYGKALTSIRAADTGAELDKRLGFYRAEPGLVAARGAEEATATEALSRGPMGAVANRVEAGVAREKAYLRQAGVPEAINIDRFVTGIVAGDEAYVTKRGFQAKVGEWIGKRITWERPEDRAIAERVKRIGLPAMEAPPAQFQDGGEGGGIDQMKNALEANTAATRENSAKTEASGQRRSMIGAGVLDTHSE